MSSIFPQFISNDPTGEDLFESNAQKQLAEKVAAQIRGGQLRFIGLDGSWGAGKSNVVHLIKAALQVKEAHEPTYHFFVYNAWSHQEDLYRRSFLEELTAFLITGKIVEKRKWTQELKRLLSKSRETEKVVVPKLNPMIFISIILSIAAPLLPVLQARYFPKLTADEKFLLNIAPLGLVVAGWLLTVILQYRKGLGFGRLLLELKDKGEDNMSYENIYESEPTTRQFRRWLSELSVDITRQKKKPARVVIVIDDLDRLPKDKIQSIWASINTFFADLEQTYEGIKVIVPFDGKHIEKAFYDQNDDQKQLIAKEFIQKTFPVVLSVPPLLSSEWQDFFDNKYKLALGDTEEEERHTVRLIFRLYEQKITPRKIIVFINELVALRLTRMEPIPLRYLALFVYAKEAIISNPARAIFSKDSYIKQVNTVFERDEKVYDYLAAIVYNVKVKKASQITVYKAIVDASYKGDLEELPLLTLHPDFPTMLLDAISSGAVNTTHMTTMLQSLENDQTAAVPASMPLVWEKLVYAQMAAPIYLGEFDPAFAILIKKITDKGLLLYFVKYLIEQFQKDQEFKGKTYYRSMHLLEETLKTIDEDVDFVNLIHEKYIGAPEFMNYVEAAGENYTRYKLKTMPVPLDNHLAQMLNSPHLNENILSHIKNDFAFPALQTEAERKIQNPQNADELYPVIQAYKLICKNRPLPVRLSDAFIYKSLEPADRKRISYFELLAMRVARGQAFVNNGIDKMSSELSLAGPDAVEALMQSIEYYKNLGDLLVDVVSWEMRLLREVLKKKVLTPSKHSIVHARQLLSKFTQICKVIEVTPEQLFAGLNVWTEVSEGGLRTQDIGSAVKDVIILSTAIKTGGAFEQSLIKLSLRHMLQLSEAQWVDILDAPNSFLYGALRVLLEAKKLDKLPAEIENAVAKLLVNIAENGEHQLLKEAGTWRMFYEASSNKRYAKQMIDIRDWFLAGTRINIQKFKFFEAMLRLDGSLLECPGEVVEMIIAPLFHLEEARTLIVAHKDFYLPLIQAAGRRSRPLFTATHTQRVKESMSSEANKFITEAKDLLHQKIKILSAELSSINNQDKVDVTEIIQKSVEEKKQLEGVISADLLGIDNWNKSSWSHLIIHMDYAGEKSQNSFTVGDKWYLP